MALCASTALACIQPAFAQDADGAAQASNSNEIIVTANKREQNLNDVGLSITAFSGDTLEDNRVASLEDLSSAVPGLVFATSTANTPILTIRGVGFNESTLAVYPAVSAYVDQAPLPFPVMASHAVFDLERVEVLKGPQGTLFGQNSTGGAINFIANKPTKDFEAGATLGYGNFDQMEASGYMSGPLTSTLGARLAVKALKSDDWQQSASRPGDTNGGSEYYAGRLILDFEPSDTARFSLNLNAWQDKSDPQAQQHIAVRSKNTTGLNHLVIIAQPFTEETARAADWSTSARPKGNSKQWQASLRSDVDLSDDIALTSLTNFVHYTRNNVNDADGLPIILGDLQQIRGKIETFTQELRIANDASNSLRWLVGANYERSKASEFQQFKFDNLTSSRPATLFIDNIEAVLNQKIDSVALFGNLEYDVSDQLTLKASARYTDTKNDSNNCMFDAGDGKVAQLFNILGGIFGGGTPFTPLVAGGGCIALNSQGVPGDLFESKLSENNVSWRVGADFKASDDVLLYALVSRGYKAGSFPSLPAASDQAQLQPVTQESITSYEAGLKATLLDGRAQFNSSVFYYDYKDKQVRGKRDVPPFGALDALINVDKSRLFGAEMDARIEPIPGLTFNGSVTYLDSKITQEVNFNVLGVLSDFSGAALPYTPKWSYSLGVDARGPVGGGEVFFGATYHGQSSQDSNIGSADIVIPAGPFNGSLVTNPFLIESYATLDMRAGFETDVWKFSLWGKNVTDQYYYSAVTSGSDTFSRFAGKPATYGVTASVKIR